MVAKNTAMSLEHRIEAFHWLVANIEVIVAALPTLTKITKSRSKDVWALQSCLKFLNETNKQLTLLQKSKAAPAKITTFFQATRPDEITYDLLEQLWKKGINKYKNKFLFSPVTDPIDNLINILNEREKNHLLRLVGIVLQNAQAHHLDPKNRVFISHIKSNFVFNPYNFLHDYTFFNNPTLPRIEFSKDELSTMIHRLIFIGEYMEKKLRKKDLMLLKSLQKKLEEIHPKYSNNTYKVLCQQILISIFMKAAENMGGIDNFIKTLNKNIDRHFFYREIGLILQNQFHKIATKKWDRKIYDMRHFYIPPIVCGVFKQMHF